MPRMVHRADAGDLIECGLHTVARVVGLDQGFGDLLHRQPLDHVGKTALVDESRPIGHRDKAVFSAFVDQLLQQLFFLTRIDTGDLERARQPIDARGDDIELMRLVLVFDEIGDRDALVICRGGKQWIRVGKEAGQPQRIVLLIEDQVPRSRRVPDDALGRFIPDFMRDGFLTHPVADRPLTARCHRAAYDRG